MFLPEFNNAQLAIRDIRLAIEYPDPSGIRQQATRFLAGMIPAGKYYTADLGLGPYKNTSTLNTFRIRVTGAQLVEQ